MPESAQAQIASLAAPEEQPEARKCGVFAAPALQGCQRGEK
jgi:hypothetical protein